MLRGTRCENRKVGLLALLGTGLVSCGVVVPLVLLSSTLAAMDLETLALCRVATMLERVLQCMGLACVAYLALLQAWRISKWGSKSFRNQAPPQKQRSSGKVAYKLILVALCIITTLPNYLLDDQGKSKAESGSSHVLRCNNQSRGSWYWFPLVLLLVTVTMISAYVMASRVLGRMTKQSDSKQFLKAWLQINQFPSKTSISVREESNSEPACPDQDPGHTNTVGKRLSLNITETRLTKDAEAADKDNVDALKRNDVPSKKVDIKHTKFVTYELEHSPLNLAVVYYNNSVSKTSTQEVTIENTHKISIDSKCNDFDDVAIALESTDDSDFQYFTLSPQTSLDNTKNKVFMHGDHIQTVHSPLSRISSHIRDRMNYLQDQHETLRHKVFVRVFSLIAMLPLALMIFSSVFEHGSVFENCFPIARIIASWFFVSVPFIYKKKIRKDNQELKHSISHV